MNVSPLSLGFIGGGLSSAVGYTHYSASRLDGRWHVRSGVFSHRSEVNRNTAQQWHIDPKRIYASWRDMIVHESHTLDAVVVLLPTPDHIEVICALLEANIPIICEKAMVSSLDDAKRIMHFYDTQKHFLAVTFNYSGYPMIRELHALILRGNLGTINHIELEMPQEGFVRPPDIAGHTAPPQSWRLKDAYIPTICLDLGVHLHHLAYFLTQQEPSQVMAEFNNYSQYPLVDNVNMWLRYDSGMSGSFWLTKTAIGSRNGLKVRVFGSSGSAEWYQMEPELLRLASIDGDISIIDRGRHGNIISHARYNRMKVGHPSGFIEAFANLYIDIADALIEWKETKQHSNPYVFDAKHATNGLLLFHNATTAHNMGQWIDNK